ncbi:hypothetical protein BG910_01780 [Neisseria chenwenguii]|uniref:Uncharacterized protein n=1 Tax=Neisseria chenwenguii TaxID=1853278 RepID=A0A220RZI8_9NEIS|nr:hypothetical protein BG910_01780 [Neisseria chenwenguii]
MVFPFEIREWGYFNDFIFGREWRKTESWFSDLERWFLGRLKTSMPSEIYFSDGIQPFAKSQ